MIKDYQSPKEGQMRAIICTVVFLLSGDGKKVYLGQKTAKVGVGKFTGPGGKQETGEALEACAVRETREEIGVKVTNLEKVAIITFDNASKLFEVHFYTTSNFSGTPQDGEEMTNGQWFDIAKLLSNLGQIPLMAGDHYFLPLIFSGRKIVGTCVYADDQQKIVQSWTHEVVEHLN